ncbi:MAG: M14 family metallopeptidase [Rhodoferax sp.]
MQASDAFSSSYAQARDKFLTAAQQAGLAVLSYPHPLPGRDGEALAIDVVRDGPASAGKLLIVSSGCHGVEGFCGSGVQVNALQDEALRARFAASGVAVLHLHALNPYGFSHIRRFTQENVDLNRNFQDFSRPLPTNPAYRRLHPLLLPEKWPPGAGNYLALGWQLVRHGMRSAQAAVSGGQYEFADGLFFGGTGPTWSNVTLRRILREHAAQARRLAWIDLHTGLGASGACERGFAGRGDDSAALERARRWWGGAGATPVTVLGGSASVSAPLAGLMWGAVYDECPQAEITAIGMEFGTLALLKVLQALRAEQWLTKHPQADAGLAARIKQDLRDAFYIDRADWKEAIVRQSRQAMLQAFAD